MKRILILTFYFGKSPWYLDYFIQSCLYNKDVDFVFFTDIEGIKVEGGNVKINNISFNDFSSIIENHFNFDLCIENPIKLCDIRPSFGEVFSNLVSNYDFWGYCDIDIIFGRIRSFLDEEVLGKYDIISSKHVYLSGFFTIYKNSLAVNSLYRSSDSFITVFQSKDLLLFDECGGFYDEVYSGTNILDTQYKIDSMQHILERHKDSINVLYEFFSIEASPGHLRYDKGILTYCNKFEVLLYHLTNFKKNFFFKNANNTILKNYNSYYIGKYLITKSNWLSIFKNNLFCLISPLIKYTLFELDYYLNNLIIRSKINKTLSVGVYQYMNRILNINFQNNKYFIVYPDGRRNEIFFLKYHQNIFFEKKFKQYYLMDGLLNGYYTSFNRIFNDECLMIYKLVK